jgi:DNA-binding FrmR family transcriptional regulator
MTTVRDARHQKELILRLKRVEGQLRGIQAMIAAGAECEQVTQQLAACRKALDKAFFNVLACAIQAGGEVPAGAAGKAQADKRLQHAADLLARFG